MAIAHEFEYLKPETLDETVGILAEYGPRARVLAGGTDLIVWIMDDLTEPDVLVDIKGIGELKGIELKDNTLIIRALVTFNELIDSEIVREKSLLIMEMARTVASTGIRNRATMIGNICSAVPSCDSGPVLLVYDAKVLVKGPQGERKIPLSEWFRGPKETALSAGELVTGVAVPLPEKRHAGCYVKLGRYRGGDLAQASVAVLALAGDNYRVAFGAVGPTPVRARKIESLINGKKIESKVIEDAKELISQEISPITDIRAAKEYRTHMVNVMFERGIRAATARLSGKGPAYGTSLI